MVRLIRSLFQFFTLLHSFCNGLPSLSSCTLGKYQQKTNRSTLWETRCSYINQPQSFSNTQYLLIAITMILIFRRKTKSQYSKLCTVIKPRKTNNKVELLSLPLIWSIWNSSINILKEIHSRTTSLKLKLLLLCGDVEANPGPYCIVLHITCMDMWFTSGIVI